jgi:hypothetical protein
LAPGQTASSRAQQLVGERDPLLDQVLAGAGQRPQRLRLVGVGRERPRPVRVGAGELGEHVSVEAVRLAAAATVAVTGGRQLIRMHGDDGDPGVEQPGDDQPVRLLARDPRHLQLAKAADEPLDPVLCMADPSLLEPSPVGIHDDQSVLLAGQVDSGRALLQALGRATSCRLTPPGGAGLTRAVCAASVEGALPAAVSYEPTLRTAPVDPRTDCVRADSRISKNRQNHGQGRPMSVFRASNEELLGRVVYVFSSERAGAIEYAAA